MKATMKRGEGSMHQWLPYSGIYLFLMIDLTYRTSTPRGGIYEQGFLEESYCCVCVAVCWFGSTHLFTACVFASASERFVF